MEGIYHKVKHFFIEKFLPKEFVYSAAYLEHIFLVERVKSETKKLEKEVDGHALIIRLLTCVTRAVFHEEDKKKTGTLFVSSKDWPIIGCGAT
jgi:hypothetical protein